MSLPRAQWVARMEAQDLSGLCQEVTLSGLSVILQQLLALGASMMLSTLPGFTSSVLRSQCSSREGRNCSSFTDGEAGLKIGRSFRIT